MAAITEIPDTPQGTPTSNTSDAVDAGNATKQEDEGFLGSLVGSILEPGVNKALFQAMNFSFLALIVTLGGLAFLTSYNLHVVFLMVVSAGLWGTMIWFVAEISKVQTHQNGPLAGSAPSDAPDLLSSGLRNGGQEGFPAGHDNRKAHDGEKQGVAQGGKTDGRSSAIETEDPSIRQRKL